MLHKRGPGVLPLKNTITKSDKMPLLNSLLLNIPLESCLPNISAKTPLQFDKYWGNGVEKPWEDQDTMVILV